MLYARVIPLQENGLVLGSVFRPVIYLRLETYRYNNI